MANIPTYTLSDKEWRVLVATIKTSRPTTTVRRVADFSMVPLATTHEALSRLKGFGLVTWEPNRSGTLRSLVKMEKGIVR